jgi:hypothetical protein
MYLSWERSLCLLEGDAERRRNQRMLSMEESWRKLEDIYRRKNWRYKVRFRSKLLWKVDNFNDRKSEL